ncbi:MAG: monovalent cation/H(+) antiporter subunit G [Acidobacteria bacterium]|nr:MAG: monovalent cation/H(+) antiporter subunit G [Acidobacteriota bacterium]REK10597.1 MAG: monovalent cation/H(+) antiporter subunit G [Acidobacteriota bacterium]
MDLVLDVASWVLLVAGGSFCVIGGIGVVRFPDFYTRVHAAGVTDTLGAGAMLAGLALQAGFGNVAVKLLLVALFLFATSPIATHALVKAAYARGVALDLPLPREAADPDAAGAGDEEAS